MEQRHRRSALLQSEDNKADAPVYQLAGRKRRAAGLAIYDTMQFTTVRWPPIASGSASMAAVLLAAGAPATHALPNSRDDSPAAGGHGRDCRGHHDPCEEFAKIKEKLNNILLKHTGQSLERIERDTDRDRFMSPGARDYGLMYIIEHVPQQAEPAGRN